MSDTQSLIKMLQSNNPDKRYDACEELRVSPSLPPEALEALKLATNDTNPDVADAARRAIKLHSLDKGATQIDTPLETPHEIFEWGPWILWILASATAGGFAITNTFFEKAGLFSTPFGASLGGVIGGIVVGFMPWLAQKYRISKVGWWVCTLISTALTVIALAIVIIDFRSGFDYYVVYWIIPPVIASSILALVIRGICQRWLKSQAGWWEWVLAGILVLIVLFVLFFVSIFTSSQ